jgi:hypothetical protein
MNPQNTEFIILGLGMSQWTKIIGSLLTTWGFLAYFLSSQKSLTPMIPSLFGALFLFMAALAYIDNKRKHHYMYIVMLLCVFCMFGGARLFMKYTHMSYLSLASHLILLISGLVLFFFGVASVRARKKEKNELQKPK